MSEQEIQAESPPVAKSESSPRRQTLRRVLFLSGFAVALVVTVYVYLFGGRYVSTDDAYVKADKVNISAELAARVVTVAVHENQPVAAGDLLFALDPAPFKVAVQDAEAGLQQARLEVNSLKAAYGQKVSVLKSAQSDLSYQHTHFRRVDELRSTGVVSQANLDDARHALEVAENHVVELRHDLDQALAQLNGRPGLPVEQHPRYLSALSALAKARLNLQRTDVYAPIAGIASKVPAPGVYAMPGLSVMSVVAEAECWVEANFKESELEHIRPGQVVDVRVDSYPGVRWQAVVDSIGQATGSEFSILPAQNASGNWVKVVQRIPVRIRLAHQDGEAPLRAGMSANIRVDTGQNSQNASRLLTWLGPGQAAASTP